MDGYDTKANAEEFAAMLGGGQATAGAQERPARAPAAPPP